MAYRGLGDVAQAEAHLAQQGNVDPRPADPLMREIDTLLQSPEAYNIRGGAELDAGHWEAAAENFRKGLELDRRTIRHSDIVSARRSTRWATRRAPTQRVRTRCSATSPDLRGRISASACC